MANKTPEHLTNIFCKKRGIKATDLENHNCADDIVLLLVIKEEFDSSFDPESKGLWAAYWSRVYHYCFPLKAKHHKKLLGICEQALKVKQAREEKQAKVRLKINTLRQAV
jgi:hypothetical protein